MSDEDEVSPAHRSSNDNGSHTEEGYGFVVDNAEAKIGIRTTGSRSMLSMILSGRLFD